jgi:hypothetical protein
MSRQAEPDGSPRLAFFPPPARVLFVVPATPEGADAAVALATEGGLPLIAGDCPIGEQAETICSVTGRLPAGAVLGAVVSPGEDLVYRMKEVLEAGAAILLVPRVGVELRIAADALDQVRCFYPGACLLAGPATDVEEAELLAADADGVVLASRCGPAVLASAERRPAAGDPPPALRLLSACRERASLRCTALIAAFPFRTAKDVLCALRTGAAAALWFDLASSAAPQPSPATLAAEVRAATATAPGTPSREAES